MSKQNPQKAVLITGASTGIGKATALQLAENGWQVFAGVRKEEDAERLKQQSGNISPVLLDVTDDYSIRKAVTQIEDTLKGRCFDALVNNAGIVVSGPLECLTTEDLKYQFDVNVFGLVAITNACLPLLKKAKGRVVNISSIAGLQAIPYIGAYSASKFALEAFSDVMRLEFKQWGIDVVAIEPGAISTPLWEKAEQKAVCVFEKNTGPIRNTYQSILNKVRSLSRQSNQNGDPPEVVATAIEKALTVNNPKTRYVIGRDATLGQWATCLPDTWLDWLKLKRLN